MRRLFAAAFCLASTGAFAQPVSFADLEGLTLEANWIEAMTYRPEKEKTPRKTTSPRQVTLAFGPNGAIQHKLVRVAGKNSRTENRQMILGKSQRPASASCAGRWRTASWSISRRCIPARGGWSSASTSRTAS